MITEDYVSFEIAKLLKGKGFNEKLLTFYITDEAKKEGCFQLMAFTDDKIDNNHSDYCYLAPTIQMTMKWLREVHNLWCEISPEGKELWYTETYSLIDEEYIPNSNSHKNESYEEACETAILYCLKNLI